MPDLSIDAIYPVFCARHRFDGRQRKPVRPVQQDVQVEERPAETLGRPQADQIQVQTCNVFETNVDLDVFGLLGKHIFIAWTDE